MLGNGPRAELSAIAVEGKAGEDLGPTLAQWRRDASRGKHPPRGFRARHAVMLVQSFSRDDHFEDYEAFVASFGAKPVRGGVVRLNETGDRTLWAGWVDSAVQCSVKA